MNNFYNLSKLSNGILKGNRTELSKAITLIESEKNTDFKKKIKLFDVLAKSNKLFSQSKTNFFQTTKRIGITGIPGSGKSTLINKIVKELIKKNHKVAVIAIDPSSEETKGSILGDKLRMENIIGLENVFIRPVPSASQIDGTSNNINETIILCEYAGYDYIIIETVGVGQSAIGIKNVVDCIVNVNVGGTGDEIQSIKKGILETVDIVIINKNEEINKHNVQSAKLNLKTGLHIMKPKYKGWIVPILLTSALKNTGIVETIEKINYFFEFLNNNNLLIKIRKNQRKIWIKNAIIKGVIKKLDKININNSKNINPIKEIKSEIDKIKI